MIKNIYSKILLIIFLMLIALSTKTYAANSKLVKNIEYKHVGEGISLIWEQVTDVTGYTIYIKGEKDDEYKELDDKEINDNKALITNVDPSAKYFIKILAYTEVKKGGKTTKEYPVTLDKATEVTIDLKEKTSNVKIENFKVQVGDITNVVRTQDPEDRISRKVSFDWNGVDGADGYTLFLNTPFSNYTFSKEYETTNTEYSLDLPNHEKGEKYTATIGAFKNVDGKKEYIAYSKQKSFEITDTKYLEKVNLYAPKYIEGIVTFRWDPVENADGYEVHLTILGATDTKKDIDLPPEDSKDGYVTYSLKDLQYGCTARVVAYKKVANSNERIYGEFSDEKGIEINNLLKDSNIVLNQYGWENATRIVNNWDGAKIYEHADTSSKV